jgi:hypothetical protein
VFVETLNEETKSVLAALGRRRWMPAFYVAGGTAAALQLGHRVSVDLDFFTPEPLDTRQLLQRVQRIGTFDLQTESPGTLIGTLQAARVSFFHYPYPLLEPTSSLYGVRIASLVDIGLMKLTAASQRGSRKDFVDLFFICRQVKPLSELLALLSEKYQGVKYSLPHLLRSLVYFDDAEAEPMPPMLKPMRWAQVKRFFEKEVAVVAKGVLNP